MWLKSKICCIKPVLGRNIRWEPVCLFNYFAFSIVRPTKMRYLNVHRQLVLIGQAYNLITEILVGDAVFIMLAYSLTVYGYPIQKLMLLMLFRNGIRV